jgi:hypothetical protein
VWFVRHRRAHHLSRTTGASLKCFHVTRPTQRCILTGRIVMNRHAVPSAQSSHSSFSAVRNYEFMLTGLRISHTHCYLLRAQPAPYCTNCSAPPTVSHILIDCPRHAEPRCLYLLHGSQTCLVMTTDSISNVLACLNAVGLSTAFRVLDITHHRWGNVDTVFRISGFIRTFTMLVLFTEW